MREKNTTNTTVLLVEDVGDTRYFMRLELEECGYHVVEAEDGTEAIAVALRECPDIILMDLSLPKVDGFEATRQIRMDKRLGDIPIIAVTAHQESDFREGAKNSGFNAYVTKPIDIDWLHELIASLLA